MKNTLINYLTILNESTDPNNPFYQDWIKAKEELKEFHNKHNPQMLLLKYTSKGVELKDIPAADRKIIEEYNAKIAKVTILGNKKNEWETGIKRGVSEEPPRTERPRSSTGSEYTRTERPSGSARSEYRGWSRTYNGKTYTNWDDYWRDFRKDFDEQYAKAHYTYKGKTYSNFRDYWNAGAADRAKKFAKDNYTYKGKTYPDFESYWNAKSKDINRKFKRDMNRINKKYSGGYGGGYKTTSVKPARAAAISFAIIFILIAIRIYAEHLRQAQAQANSSKISGNNRKIFLRKHRIIGLQKQILVLRNSLVNAVKTKNPEKFKQKINERIVELKNRIIKLEGKV